jgi:glutamyl-tRNA synthetase
LYRALDYPEPHFLHVPLAVDEGGVRLAKRRGAVGLGPLRASGLAPATVVTALAASAGLARLGNDWDASELLARFDPASLQLEPSMIAVDHQ